MALADSDVKNYEICVQKFRVARNKRESLSFFIAQPLKIMYNMACWQNSLIVIEIRKEG